MMSDLRGFTAIAESRDPQEVVRFLNCYLEGMLNIILSYQGTIIEILGDGLLVLFGAPIGRQDDAERAVACAVSMQLHMDEVNALLRQDNLPELEMGIGLHTGEVVVGNLGSVKYTRYGVSGGAVNLTGRIESYTTGNQILISPTTYAATADMLTVRQTLTIEPKGIAEPVSIYDVGGIGGTHQLFLPEQQDDLAPLTHELLVSYTVLEGNFPGQGMSTGRLVQLGVKSAELDIDEPVAALSCLKIRLYHPNGEPVPGALFAKVLTDASTEISTRVVMRFTYVPQHIQTFLDDAKRRWEFRMINRSVQL
ncbi:hypothetical protein C2W62_00915 [Candidatus Entotheonella serta]|nr:hypothetical protein C2W62_00915 [Candidatus Entotheonella serta]